MSAAQTLGDALADRYRIERELGAGGMATVYLAHDLRHERNVAIKVLHPDLGAALGGERFLSEIKTTAKLQHPHILPLLETALSVSLAATTRSSLRRADTQDPEAREATLLGWNLVSRRGDANITQAVIQFRRAIARDSMYARAWAGLAEAQAVGPSYGVALVDSTRSAARRAVELDSLSSEAWVALASTLTFEVRLREAEAPLRLSTRLDPLVAAYEARLMWLDLATANADSLARRGVRVRALEPTNVSFIFFAAGAYAQLGLMREGIEACATQVAADVCRKALEVLVDPTRRAEAIASLEASPGPGALPLLRTSSFRAAAYAHLGETDKAFASLQSAFESTNDRLLFGYINSPWFAPLRSDPRWQSIVVAGQSR